MSEPTNNSVISLGDLAKPAETLIQKISDAVGGVFAPYQIKRLAIADAEASLIRAQSEIHITDLQRSAMHRFVEEETRRQENIESITSRALPQLKEGSDPSVMDDDWVSNFFDKSRIVSNGEMQDLWARVLAGEANVPGSYSKRTVNFLADLDKRDAEMFQALCRFGWQIGGFDPLVFDVQAPIYSENGVTFNTLTHLESIGLIKFDALSGFTRTGLPQKFAVTYFGRPLILQIAAPSKATINTGHVIMTQLGRELATVCKISGVPNFEEYVKQHWKAHIPAPIGD